MSKTQSVINMLSMAVKRGFEFDDVLFDSWFFSKEILTRIESFRLDSANLDFYTPAATLSPPLFQQLFQWNP